MLGDHRGKELKSWSGLRICGGADSSYSESLQEDPSKFSAAKACAFFGFCDVKFRLPFIDFSNFVSSGGLV